MTIKHHQALALFVCVLGLALSSHIWIQHQNGFDRGCLGIDSEGSAAGACSDPAFLEMRVLGVPPPILGFCFYGGLSISLLVQIVGSQRSASVCRTGGAILLGLAVPQTLYLLYLQAFVIGAFCSLCLLSAGFVAVLSLLGWLARVRLADIPAGPSVADLGTAVVSLSAGVVVFAATLIFADRIGVRGGDLASAAKSSTTVESESGSRKISPELDLEAWNQWKIPPINAPSELTVVFFLDPNCPHCAQTFEAFSSLAQAYDGKASFYIYCRMLWPKSLRQASALELARSQGRYYEAWREMFRNQKVAGMKDKEIASVMQAAGVKAGDLAKELGQRTVIPLAQTRLARQNGINATPTIYVAGKLVPDEAMSGQGLRSLIDEALRQRTDAASR